MRDASSANNLAGDASHICIVSDREYTAFSPCCLQPEESSLDTC